MLSFAACNQAGNKNIAIPSLLETYSKTDKKPFGSFIAYRQLQNMYKENTVKDKTQSFTKTWSNISDTASLYVCFTQNLYVNDDEIKAMLNYVHAGNTLFIAANYFDESFLKEIDCDENYNPLPYYKPFDSMRQTQTTFYQTAFDYSATNFYDTSFGYFYHPFKNSFKFTDTVFTKVLGLNDENKPNYIMYFHGNGKLLLHCDPKAFSNYFLLKKDNYKYMQNSFSFTNNTPTAIYWDDYYRKLLAKKSNSNNNFSSFSEIMKHPPLAAAFWLSLILLGLYILFGGKRRQRIIATIKPNDNTTVAFTETIGLLYLQKKDNKNIAEKMCAYFNEYIRNNYFLNTSTVNDDFITTLSRKSGVERGKVESLYRAINYAQQNAIVDDYQLLSLNEQIQNFYKKK
jgi:hypothetical protein